MIKLAPVLSAAVIALGLGFGLGVVDAHAQNAFSDPADQVAASQGGGDLAAVEGVVHGGNIPVGTRSQVIVRFRNDAPKPVTFKDINLYPSSSISADIALNQCTQEPLDAGAECAIVLGVKGLQAGAWRVEMLVRHTGRTRLATATVDGNVDAGDANASGQSVTDIEVTPSPVDFGTLTASRPIIRSVTVRNITSSPINITDIHIDAPYQSGYDLRSDCAALQSGQACIASIVWSPLIEGPTSGFLVVEHDGASRVANIALSGEFAPESVEEATIFPDAVPGKGLLVSNETMIDYGSGINAESAITLTLVNSGDAEIQLRNIQLAGSDNGLRLADNGCVKGMELAPTEACPLTLSWAPVKIGSIIDDVQIYHSGARGVLVIPVRGSAAAAVNLDNRAVVLSEGELSFPPPSVKDGKVMPPDVVRSAPKAAAPPSLDGYSITSHSIRYAVINGPGGSKVVQDGSTAILAGHRWDVDIVEDGIELSSGLSRVMLIFDRSFSSLVGGEVSSSSESSE